MIPIDFEYVRPTSIEEAWAVYQDRRNKQKRVLYYAGGTEIISMSRMGQLSVDTVIDLKAIPDCNVLEKRDSRLRMGAAVSLNQIADAGVFPLLGAHVRGIASRTARNRITLGGNLAGKIIYREAALPLACDALVLVAKHGGTAEVPLSELFHEELKLEAGEFIVQLLVDEQIITQPYFSMKKTSISSVDYPLVSLAAVWQHGRVQAAISGVCDYPFRCEALEQALNDQAQPLDARIRQAVARVPGEIVDDVFGSRAYRKFQLSRALTEALRSYEGGSHV